MAELSGHGAALAMELDGAAQGVFTNIGQLIGDIVEGSQSRPGAEATSHDQTISRHVASGRLLHAELSFTVNFDPTIAAFNEVTGLRKRLADGDTFGIRFRGPGWTTPNVDEMIYSGFVTNWAQRNPNREGARELDITFQPTGPYIVNGTTFGT